MRRHRREGIRFAGWFALAGLLLPGLPGAGGAQVVPSTASQPPGAVRAQGPAGWVGIRLEHTVVTEGDGRRTEGVRVTGVNAGSPAEAAGVLPGDHLIRVNGVPASRALEEGVFAGIRPGDRVEIELVRNGLPAQVVLRAAQLPSPGAAQLHQEELARATQELARIRADSVRLVVATQLDSVRAQLVRAQGVASTTGPLGPTRESPAMVLRRPAQGGADGSGPEVEYLIRFRPDARPFLSPPAEVELRGHLATRGSATGAPSALTVYALGERAVLGAEVLAVNPGLAAYFGVDSGVLVADVPEGTPAARSGLRAGDVVVRVQGGSVASVSTLRQALELGLRSPPVRMEVVRAGERITLTLVR